jgi:transposase
VAIHVLVDTTELFRVPLLDAAGWRELLARSRRGHLNLAISEVVVREASRHFAARVRSDLAQAERALAKLRDAGGCSGS